MQSDLLVTLKPKIEGLWKKKKLTAADLGKIYFLNNILVGTRRIFILTYEQIAERAKTVIQTPEDKETYGLYIGLSHVAGAIYVECSARYSTLHADYLTIYYNLLSAYKTELRNEREFSYPLIVSEQTYKEGLGLATQQARRNLHAAEEVLLGALESCWGKNGVLRDDLWDGVRDALNASKSLPVNNERIRAGFMEATHQGYEELPDGQRSDQMTPEEWLVQRNAYRDSLRPGDMYPARVALGGAVSVFAEAKKYGLKPPRSLNDDRVNALFTEIEEKGELSKDAQALKEILFPTEGYQWRPYDFPTNFRMYDVLKHARTAYAGHVEELAKDAPDVFAAVVDGLAAKLPFFRNLKPEEYGTTNITGGTIMDAPNPLLKGFEYRGVTEKEIAEVICDLQGLDGEQRYIALRRANSAGIAAGVKDYLDFKINDMFSLPNIINENKAPITIRNNYYSFINNICYVKAISTLSLIYERVFKVDTSFLRRFDASSEHNASILNQCICAVYLNISGSPKERIRKRNALREQVIYKTDEIYDDIDNALLKRYEADLKKAVKERNVNAVLHGFSLLLPLMTKVNQRWQL